MRDVSVVIPVYNRARLVVRALDSVAAQTRRPARLIVVDNGSDDGTPDVVGRWMSEHQNCGMQLMLLDEPRHGASAARNRGLAEVETEYVYFFDSDDVMHPDLLDQAMKGIGTADLIYWQAEYLGVDGNRSTRPFHSDDLLRRQFYNVLLCTVSYMARTELVRNVGGWNPDASVWNDWELGLRIAMSDPVAVALDEVLVTIHAQKDSITGVNHRDRYGEWEHTLDIVEQYIIGSCREDRARLLDMVDYRRAILSAQYAREGAVGYADTLLAKALQRGRPAWRRMLLRLLWKYTAAGGRGAYYLWRK